MKILELHHLQLAMPQNGEELAREFYSGLLAIPEVRKPAHLAMRGGVWFETERLKIHLGVDPDFRAAKKAHPAFIVSNLSELIEECKLANVDIVKDQPLAGFRRIYIYDPFGNRLEMMEPEE